jgi:hypothetical protein
VKLHGVRTDERSTNDDATVIVIVIVDAHSLRISHSARVTSQKDHNPRPRNAAGRVRAPLGTTHLHHNTALTVRASIFARQVTPTVATLVACRERLVHHRFHHRIMVIPISKHHQQTITLQTISRQHNCCQMEQPIFHARRTAAGG